jgi:glycosyltransferase involved in cell wall biosynthesis
MESHFALSFKARLSDELDAAGAAVHDLGKVRARQPLTVWRARRALQDLLRRERFDLVVCHSAWSQAIFGKVVRRAQLPLVFWLHDAISGRHWLERWAARTVPDLAVCNSQFTATLLPRIFPSVPVKVIYCPVAWPQSRCSPSEQLQLKEEFDTTPQATVIIQVSRMEKWKGHTVHLNALALLRDMPEWVCWFVGGAQRPREVEYAETLMKQAAELGLLNRVRFLGQRSDVSELLAAADIYCQPNLEPEPFGLTLVEALHAQLPVIATSLGGPNEIVDESCGVLVPTNDAGAVTEALSRLIKDSVLRQKLGSAGPTRATGLCDVTTQMRLLDECFTEVRDHYGRPPVAILLPTRSA